ncbi:MAG: DUF177 domain-containing protein [Dehalococcoidia bacterium]|nr:DUF177 domain-containing protein [Dehalococcoidia bacterium]
MRYNVSQLLKELTGSTRHYDVDEVLASPEAQWGVELVVRGPVEMVRTPRGILVIAELTSQVPEVCSRCVEPLTEPVVVALEEEFFPSVDVWSGAPVHVPDVDGYQIDQRHILDLGEAFRQGVWTALEIQPLCNPGCRGLCLNCGVNLNRETCSCDATPADPRWERLRRRSV